MTTAVDNWPAYARLLAVASAGQLPTAPTPLGGTQPGGPEYGDDSWLHSVRRRAVVMPGARVPNVRPAAGTGTVCWREVPTTVDPLGA
jgi:hypothetical protein